MVPDAAHPLPRPAGGPLCAAILIGQTAGAERLANDAQFAGVAAIPVSSVDTTATDSIAGGNRQLNRALHVIAITPGRLDPETWAYLAHKEVEAKGRIEARRCPKPRLPRHYHRLLLRLRAGRGEAFGNRLNGRRRYPEFSDTCPGGYATRRRSSRFGRPGVQASKPNSARLADRFG